MALAAELSQAFGSQTPVSRIYRLAVAAINQRLGMDRTFVLLPTERQNWFRVGHWAGLTDEAAAQLGSLTVEIPPEVAKGTETLLFDASPGTAPVGQRLGRSLGLSEFICVPVLPDPAPVALLLSGRTPEPVLDRPALGGADAEILTVGAALLAAALMRGRIAALEETDRLKTASFANLSHEFRTPLTLSLSPLEQILSTCADELPAHVVSDLRLVHRNQERLLALINQILELARLEMGDVPLKLSPMGDVNSFIQDRVTPFRAVAQSRGIHFWLALEPGLVGADLYLDAEQFDRLLSNLLSNALKFTEAGAIKVGTELSKGTFGLIVADTGIGIGEDELPYVFDRFRRGEQGEGRVSSGTGIGLALVKEVAARHGGEVSVHSQIGKGSSFRVRIPLGSANFGGRARLTLAEEAPVLTRRDDGAIAASTRPETGDVERANRRAERELDPAKPVVLYVEDNADMRGHVADLLRVDCNVFVAADGREGLELTRHYQPDLVVTDQMMPTMSGSELLRALQADPALASTPVLLLTAVSSPETRIDALEAGADDYLTKPFHQGELRARVRNLVRARTQERVLAELNRRLEARVEQQMAELVRTGELKRFLPQPVVEQLLTGELKAASGFERRKITLLLVDAVGFTALADDLEPEELALVLNEYLAEITAAAVTRGGTVDNLLADGLMVIFGAPRACEDTDGAWCAVQAALAMREGVASLNARLRRRGVAAELQVRVGINTGFCTVGVFGSELLHAYTAVGLPVNVAVRLQAEAGVGKVLCGGSTVSLVETRVSARQREVVHMPGTTGTVDAYEIIDVIDGRADAADDDGAASRNLNLVPKAPAEVRLFRKEGDFWTIAYEGSVFRLKDSKGLGYLAQLLARPRREVHVLDLFTGGESQPESRGATSYRDMTQAQLAEIGLGGRDSVDAGAMLDPQAKAAYKRRLQDLQEDLEEADAFNDPERSARAQAEIDALVQALAASVGLGGRDRKAASGAERARLNVTRAIKAAVEKIGQNNVSLGQHLTVSLNTGMFCSYTPDPGLPATWTF